MSEEKKCVFDNFSFSTKEGRREIYAEYKDLKKTCYNPVDLGLFQLQSMYFFGEHSSSGGDIEADINAYLWILENNRVGEYLDAKKNWPAHIPNLPRNIVQLLKALEGL